MKKTLVTIFSLALLAGVISPVQAQSNKTPWSDGSQPVISINNDAVIAETGDVKLALHITNAEEMMVSNDPGFIGSEWGVYLPEVNWKIYTDEGLQYVYVIFRNVYGTSDVYKDTIFYKTTISSNRKTLEEWIAIADGSANTSDSQSNPLAEGEALLPEGVRVGMLVKGSGHATYYIGIDHNRHVFPTLNEYESWNQTFAAVVTVSDSTLSKIALGKNMQIRPGTNLVKIATDPKVYAVDSDGSLRWVSSSAIALSLYGVNWEKRLIDIPVTRFADYKVGQAINSSVYLDGTILRNLNGNLFKAEKGVLRPISQNGYYANDYQDRFVLALNQSNSAPIGTDEVTKWEPSSLPVNSLLSYSK